jgi:ATP-binding cassette subfamily F protein 3
LWLEKFLKESMNYNILVITSHDQVFLDRLSEQTICLREQRLDYFDGTPTAMQTVEAEERVHKEKVVSAMDKKREHVSPLTTRVKLTAD